MKPRLAFVGVGWIGRNRMEAVIAAGAAEAVAVADASPEAATAAADEVGAKVVEAQQILEDPASLGLDGVVIATPSALHAEQSMTALAAGSAVFCQKPLARTAQEVAAIVEAAQRQDRLLGVDMSYRHLAATTALRDVLASRRLGEIYAAELVFHNAYGPDKAWFTDPELAGGGCVIDLGVHLVDLALWLLGEREEVQVDDVTARLFADGKPLQPGVVEDFAMARLDLSSGAVASLACSWFLHAGRDAVIAATFHGSSGSVAIENVGGSFYDFRAVERHGTGESALVEPPDAWGGRAIVRWAEQLASGVGFDPSAEDLVSVANVIDRIYGR